MKFHGWDMIIKGDILIQKIKVKNQIFRLLSPSFHWWYTHVYMTYIS